MSIQPNTATPLLSIRNLSVSYVSRGQSLAAVLSVNLDVGEREVVALVGESGSGKTTIARAIMAMLAPQGAHHRRIYRL